MVLSTKLQVRYVEQVGRWVFCLWAVETTSRVRLEYRFLILKAQSKLSLTASITRWVVCDVKVLLHLITTISQLQNLTHVMANQIRKVTMFDGHSLR